VSACESLLDEVNVDGGAVGVLSIVAIMRDVLVSAEAEKGQ